MTLTYKYRTFAEDRGRVRSDKYPFYTKSMQFVRLRPFNIPLFPDKMGGGDVPRRFLYPAGDFSWQTSVLHSVGFLCLFAVAFHAVLGYGSFGACGTVFFAGKCPLRGRSWFIIRVYAVVFPSPTFFPDGQPSRGDSPASIFNGKACRGTAPPCPWDVSC